MCPPHDDWWWCMAALICHQLGHSGKSKSQNAGETPPQHTLNAADGHQQLSATGSAEAEELRQQQADSSKNDTLFYVTRKHTSKEKNDTQTTFGTSTHTPLCRIGKLLGPFPRSPVMLCFVGFEKVGDVGDQRVVGVGVG